LERRNRARQRPLTRAGQKRFDQIVSGTKFKSQETLSVSVSRALTIQKSPGVKESERAQDGGQTSNPPQARGSIQIQQKQRSNLAVTWAWLASNASSPDGNRQAAQGHIETFVLTEPFSPKLGGMHRHHQQ